MDTLIFFAVILIIIVLFVGGLYWADHWLRNIDKDKYLLRSRSKILKKQGLYFKHEQEKQSFLNAEPAPRTYIGANRKNTSTDEPQKAAE